MYNRLPGRAPKYDVCLSCGGQKLVKSHRCITCSGRTYYPHKYIGDKQNAELSPKLMKNFLENAKGKLIERNKALLAMVFLTGGRPNEIALMKKEDVFDWPEDEGFVCLRLFNSKLGKVRHFKIRERTLIISKDSALMEHIIKYAENVVEPTQKLFPLTTRRIEQIWEQTTKGYACPYTARHQRLVEVSRRTGGDLTELLNWKGSVDLKSITPYLSAKPTKPARIGVGP